MLRELVQRRKGSITEVVADFVSIIDDQILKWYVFSLCLLNIISVDHKKRRKKVLKLMRNEEEIDKCLSI